MEESGIDDKPIAQRRKRRASTALQSPEKSRTKGDSSKSNQQSGHAHKTPTKSKKRVRFSDPGPEVLQTDSTGITPFVKRATLQPCSTPAPPTPRLLARPPRRRVSLPDLSSSGRTSSSSDLSSSVEVQFAPLRQVLSDRFKRRIRRNHLSEELNDIEADKRDNAKRKQEISALKEELALARQLGSELTSTTVGQADHTRIEELEREISELKSEARGRFVTVDPDFSMSTEDDSISVFTTHSSNDADTAFIMADTPPDTPSTPVTPLSTTHTTDTAIQTSFTFSPPPDLESHISTQSAHLLRARLDLEHLCPGETSLGLSPPDNGDCSPILTALIAQLRSSISTLHSTRAALTTTQTQESNLRAQFNATLLKLSDARTAASEAEKRHSETTKMLPDIHALEKELDERQRSVDKLTAALDTYRSEVSSLETLITRLEAESLSQLNALRAEKNQAISDLECLVAAETRGRREAETECEDRGDRIRVLQLREQDLRDVVAEKQGLVRKLEDEMEEVKRDAAVEVGGANVRVSRLGEELEGARVEIRKSEAERAAVLGRMRLEREVSKSIVEALRGELKQVVGRVEGVVGEWLSGVGERERATEKADKNAVTLVGLLTPEVEGGRFRDVAGEGVVGVVEMKRGREAKRGGRKVDSGIGILEEDVEGEEDVVE